MSATAEGEATGERDGAGRAAAAPRPRLVTLFPFIVGLGLLAVCAQGLSRTTLWKSAEPRVMEISRDQYDHGLLRSLTFAGMPFLEEPPFDFDLNALAFHVAGGPSVLAARAVVALLGALWIASIALLVRRAAGRDAALLAAALLAVATGFTGLMRRFGVDTALVACLSLSLALLYRAIATDAPRVEGRWWFASLGALACAALTKGIFASFLFVMPTLAYALLAGDRRVLVALFRPLSLLAFFAPHLLWALVLFRSGGWTYVFEHFVNNTVGRVVHTRFDVGAVRDLAYGDVGVPYPWWYFLREIPLSALPAVLAVPFALFEQRRRGGLRASDPESRLVCLALCWGCVPPLLLSFSSYKGRDHLGASTAALIAIGALWLARRLPGVGRASSPRWVLGAVLALYAAAPLLVVASFLGRPATVHGTYVLIGIAAGVAVVAIVGALRAANRTLAVWALLGALAVGCIADFSPGSNRADDESNSMDPVARWIASEAGAAPVGVFAPRARADDDPIGRAGEQAIGSLSWWLGRPVLQLRTPADVDAWLSQPAPVFFVAARSRDEASSFPAGRPGVGWAATGTNKNLAWTLVANVAASGGRAAPAEPPPVVALEPGD